MAYLLHPRIGIDIVEIDKLKRFPINEYPNFYRKYFSDYELKYALNHSNPYPHLGGFFAVKEAVYKILNSEYPVSLQAINVQHMKNGRPTAVLDNFAHLEIFLDISISHSKRFAIAGVIYSKNHPNSTSELDSAISRSIQMVNT